MLFNCRLLESDSVCLYGWMDYCVRNNNIVHEQHKLVFCGLRNARLVGHARIWLCIARYVARCNRIIRSNDIWCVVWLLLLFVDKTPTFLESDRKSNKKACQMNGTGIHPSIHPSIHSCINACTYLEQICWRELVQQVNAREVANTTNQHRPSDRRTENVPGMQWNGMQSEEFFVYTHPYGTYFCACLSNVSRPRPIFSFSRSFTNGCLFGSFR